MSLPDLPTVSKAIIQDGLCSPDFELGERPCLYGRGCESYVMCVKAKHDNPERYAAVEPFACKEFYFGAKGEAIRMAMAEGIPLSEVQNPEPVMCVMCHLSVVTQFYKKYDLGLELDPVHILHSFQVLHSVPGEYPLVHMLMGDKTFKGIIAPYIRFCPDNYTWEPVAPVIVASRLDPITKELVKERKASVQRWTERECLDFR